MTFLLEAKLLLKRTKSLVTDTNKDLSTINLDAGESIIDQFVGLCQFDDLRVKPITVHNKIQSGIESIKMKLIDSVKEIPADVEVWHKAFRANKCIFPLYAHVVKIANLDLESLKLDVLEPADFESKHAVKFRSFGLTPTTKSVSMSNICERIGVENCDDVESLYKKLDDGNSALICLYKHSHIDINIREPNKTSPVMGISDSMEESPICKVDSAKLSKKQFKIFGTSGPRIFIMETYDGKHWKLLDGPPLSKSQFLKYLESSTGSRIDAYHSVHQQIIIPRMMFVTPTEAHMQFIETKVTESADMSIYREKALEVADKLRIKNKMNFYEMLVHIQEINIAGELMKAFAPLAPESPEMRVTFLYKCKDLSDLVTRHILHGVGDYADSGMEAEQIFDSLFRDAIDKKIRKADGVSAALIFKEGLFDTGIPLTDL